MNIRLPFRISVAVFCCLLSFASLSARADTALGRRVAWPAIDLVDGSRLDARGLDGRVVLVVFWATWCPLCRTELPELQRFLATQRGTDIEVLAISLDEAPAEVRAYVHRTRLPFRFAMQTAALNGSFGPVEAIPLTLIYDRQGVLRFKHLGAIDSRRLAREIVPLLKERAIGAAVAPR